MSETKHSPEPWVYWARGIDGGIVSADDARHADAKGTYPRIIFGGEYCEGFLEADDPNVRRAIACVNACAGLPTEALEQGALAKALDAVKRMRTPLRLGALGRLKP